MLVVSIMTLPLLLSVWYSGFGPALLQYIATTAAVWLLLARPEGNWTHSSAFGATDFGLLALEGFLACLIAGSLHASRGRARARLEENEESLRRLDDLSRRLSDREERLRLAFDAAGMRGWECDAKTRTITGMGNSYLLPGGTAEDVRSLDEFVKYIHADDVGPFRVAVDKALDGTADLDIGYRIVWPDGAVRYWHSRGRVFRDEQGQPVRVMGVGMDVTESSRLERELRQQTERLQFLIGQVPGILWVFDRNLRITLALGGDGSYIAKTAKWLVGKSVMEIFEDSSSGLPAFEALRQALSGVPVRFELTAGGHDYDVGVRPITGADGVVDTVIGYSLDVSGRKRSERRLEEAIRHAEGANQAKSRFLANISHEIRTPLAVILGFADLAQDATASPADQERWLAGIKRNAMQLQALINDLLDLSKIEAERLDIEKLRVPLAEIVEDTATSLSLQAAGKGIAFSIEMAKDLPRQIMTDPLRLRQILLNVGGNAVKFTDAGSVHIRVEMQSQELVAFVVQDTGIGLSKEQQERLFQPFVQADSSTSRRYGGSGLGLVLARNLARFLGGDLTITASELGKGSIFTLTIAAEKVEDSQPRQELIQAASNAISVAAWPSSRPSLIGRRFLVAEDFEDLRQLLDLLLTQEGATVDTAEDGARAVTMALEGYYDAVLMDLQMPGVDGIKATARLRQGGYAKPIIALTAHALKGERERALAVGFSDYLTKPIERFRLVEALVRLQGDAAFNGLGERRALPGAPSAYEATHVEDRQVHGDHDEADDAADHHDHNRFDHG